MILAATGHRPNKLGGYNSTVANKLQNLAMEAIKELKPKQVISGMALGWDMAVASACVILDIPFIAAVPFKGQQSIWPEESQRLYQSLILKASDIVVTSEGGYASWKMQTRNKWMVDNCDEILALFDGTSGGTFNCIKYAESKGKFIHNFWEKLKL